MSVIPIKFVRSVKRLGSRMNGGVTENFTLRSLRTVGQMVRVGRKKEV